MVCLEDVSKIKFDFELMYLVVKYIMIVFEDCIYVGDYLCDIDVGCNV